MQKEDMTEHKKDLIKQLEQLQKTEQILTTDLANTKSNISAVNGALQYHDYIISKMEESDKSKVGEEATFEEIKTTQEIAKAK